LLQRGKLAFETGVSSFGDSRARKTLKDGAVTIRTVM
jgi:hypothetical protein